MRFVFLGFVKNFHQLTVIVQHPPLNHHRLRTKPKDPLGGFVSGIATTRRRPAKGVGYIARADGNTRVVQQDLPVLAVVE